MKLNAFTKLKKMKDRMGYNMAALKYIQIKYKSDKNHTFNTYDDIETKSQQYHDMKLFGQKNEKKKNSSSNGGHIMNALLDAGYKKQKIN